MKHLDLQVIQRALAWLKEGQPVWLCTVLATFGSAPRGPGSMLVALTKGECCGSLSGGCVEEDFLERLAAGQFDMCNRVVRYGDGGLPPTLALPCGGVLDVLVEYFAAEELAVMHFEMLEKALLGHGMLNRTVPLGDQGCSVERCEIRGPRVVQSPAKVDIQIGPAKRLIVAGVSPVAEFCAQFAIALGFEVIVCDPRPEQLSATSRLIPQAKVQEVLPALFIAQGGCHASTAVVALTHDPRLDDLTLMESVRTNAFYIGAMGSARTSSKRMERLRRIGGLTEGDIGRIHAPIGLRLGSKTPAEIAMSVMADILRVGNGLHRSML